MGEPLQLTQEMQCNRLLGTTGAVFHLDGYSKTFTHAAEALNALCTALAQDLTVAAPHQLGVETTLTSHKVGVCLLYTSPSPRDRTRSRMPSSA